MMRMKNFRASTPVSIQDENRAAEILGRVRRMEVRTNRLVDDSLAGRYASVFKALFAIVLLVNAWVVWSHFEPPEELELAWMFEGNHYLHPIKDLREDPIAYVLQNPRWMLGRIDTTDNALYVVNEDSTLVRVARITKTATSGDPYGSDAYHRTTVELVDGTSREVDSGYLVHTPLRSPKIA